MKAKSKVLFLTCLLFLTISTATPAQNAQLSWKLALPGSPVGTPDISSFGFFALSDSNSVASVTESGIILHQIFLDSPVSSYNAVLPSDHLCIVYDDCQTVSLCNPDGIILWTITLPFQCIENPRWLENGAFLFVGARQSAAVSWNGSVLWTFSPAEPHTLSPVVLPCGSILFPAVKQNSTTIYQVSVFGKQLGISTLSYPLVTLQSFQNYLFASDVSGTVYCLDPSSDDFLIKWTKTKAAETEGFLSWIQGNTVYQLQSSGAYTEYRISDGTVIRSDQLWETPLHNLRLLQKGNYSVIAGDTISRTMVYLITDSGEIAWMKSFPTKDPVFMTYSGVLCQYQNDWTITGWKTPYRHTPEVLHRNHFLHSELLPDEIGYLFDSLNTMMYRALSSSAVSSNIQYGELGVKMNDYLAVIEAAALSGWDVSAFFSEIIKNETNTAILKQTIVASSKAPYDISRQILSALEHRLSYNRAGIFDDSLCFETCNTVFSICSFMGTPAIINQGQRILTKMIDPLYSTKVQTQAILTINKLINLQKETQK